MQEQERLAAGRRIRNEVLGKSVTSTSPEISKFKEAFQDFTIEHCWANVWVRPGLDV